MALFQTRGSQADWYVVIPRLAEPFAGRVVKKLISDFGLAKEEAQELLQHTPLIFLDHLTQGNAEKISDRFSDSGIVLTVSRDSGMRKKYHRISWPGKTEELLAQWFPADAEPPQISKTEKEIPKTETQHAVPAPPESRLKDEIAKLEAQNRAVEEKIQKQKLNADTEQQRILSEWQKKAADLETRLAESEKNMQALRQSTRLSASEMVNLQKQIEKETMSRKESEDRAKQLRAELEKSRNEASATGKNLGDNQQEVQRLEKAIEEYRQKLQQYSLETQQWQRNAEKAVQEAGRLQEELVRSRGEKENLIKHLEKLESQKQTHEKTVKEWSQKHIPLEAQLEESRRNFEALQKQLVDQKSLQDRDKENLQKEIESQREKIRIFEEESRKFSGKLAAAEQEHKAFAEKAARLEDQLSASERRVKYWEEQESKQKDSLELFRRDKEMLLRQVQQLETLKQNQEKIISDWTLKCSALEKQVLDMRQELEISKKTNTEQSQRLENETKDRDTARKEKETIQKQCQTLENQLRETRWELENSKKQAAEQSRHFESEKRELLHNIKTFEETIRNTSSKLERADELAERTIELEARLEAAEQRARDLEEEKERQIKHLKTVLEETGSRQDEQAAEIRKWKERTDKALDKLEESDKALGAAAKEYEKILQKNREVENAFRELDQKAAEAVLQLQKDKEELERKAQNAESKLKETADQTKKFEIVQTELQKQLKTALEQARVWQEKAKEYEAKALANDRTAVTLRQTQEHYEAKEEEWRQLSAQAKKQIEFLEKQYEEKQREFYEAGREIKKLKDDLEKSDASAQIETLQRRIVQQEGLIKELEKSVRDAEVRASEKPAGIESLPGMEGSLKAAYAKLESLMKRFQDLQEIKNEFVTKLAEERQSHDTLKKNYQRLRIEAEKLGIKITEEPSENGEKKEPAPEAASKEKETPEEWRRELKQLLDLADQKEQGPGPAKGGSKKKWPKLGEY